MMISNVVHMYHYSPDFSRICEACGGSPCLIGRIDGKAVIRVRKCWSCFWHEEEAINPEDWNNQND